MKPFDFFFNGFLIFGGVAIISFVVAIVSTWIPK